MGPLRATKSERPIRQPGDELTHAEPLEPMGRDRVNAMVSPGDLAADGFGVVAQVGGPLLTPPPRSYIFCIQMTTKSIRAGSLLETLFTSKARVAVLELLLLGSPSRFYLRQIAALTGQPVRAVQRELARLTSAGLLKETREGNRKYYQANREASVFPELRALLLKTVGLGDVLRDGIQGSRADIVLALLFGSIARGTDEASSDIDLMVIGNAPSRGLANLLSSPRLTLGREINLVMMLPEEFRDRASTKDPFVERVLSEPKIFLVGTEGELREIAVRGATAAA
jgi:predicted nucleotidyltransferase